MTSPTTSNPCIRRSNVIVPGAAEVVGEGFAEAVDDVVELAEAVAAGA
jgi:hypothetical protein